MRRCHKFVLFFTLAVAILNPRRICALGKVVVVSDIDDTIKITHVSAYLAAAYNGIFGGDVFLGMPELLSGMIAPGRSIHYLSSSPQILQPTLEALLTAVSCPSGRLILQDWWQWQSSAAFKSEELAKIAAENPDAQFILIGDDTQGDPEIYTAFRAAHPRQKTLAIYIHRITARDLPPGVTPFATAFDLALSEVEAGRLPAPKAEEIADLLLSSPDIHLVFPSFKARLEECPRPLGPRVCRHPALVTLQDRLDAVLRERCAQADVLTAALLGPCGG